MVYFSKVWKPARLLIGLLPLATLGDVEYSQQEEENQEKAPAAMVSDEREILRQQLDEVNTVQRKELSVAMANYRGGRYSEAIAQLEKLMQDDPTILTTWNILGSVYLKANRRDDAITLWNHLRVIRPDFFPVYNWLGRAYMLRNEVPSAVEMYRQSLQLQPRQDRESTELNFARVLRWSGHLEEAATLLRPLHKEYPQRLDITRELASALISNREYEEALPLWTELRSHEPTNLLFQAKEAVALLHTGPVEEAVKQARDVLAEDALQPDALLLMADDAQFGGDKPEAALPWLQQLIAQASSFKKKRLYTLRYVFLYEKMVGQQPGRFSWSIPISMVHALVQADPYDVDLIMAYAELLTCDKRYDEAREAIGRVVTTLNPHNVRAQNNLFEIALSQGQFDEARERLQARAAFNPNDPYLHYYKARWYVAQSRYSAAHHELDQLEAAGRRGSVAVLLYHGLSAGESGEVLPVSRLREYLLTLKQAGFRFIAAHELPNYFAKRAKLQETFGADDLDRVVCVTFDDARRDTMRYGTPVGQELHIPFSMHVPVGFIEQQHPFMCTWNMLRDYQKAGCWCFGGHTFYAHERMPIDAEKRIGFALPNHLWLERGKRLETDAEYDARLTHEYTGCRDLIVQHLGHSNECNFFAYPFGDTGQITRSNDREATRKNLEHAARSYAVGFIQTDPGYAVAGDNPLLYQRYEPDRSSSGAEVLTHILEQNPINLARRMRAEVAAMQDKRHLLLSTLRALQQDGYPTVALEQLRTNLESKLGRRIPLSEIESASPAPAVSVAPGPPVELPVRSAPSAGAPAKDEKPAVEPVAPAVTNATPSRSHWAPANKPDERRRDLHNPLL